MARVTRVLTCIALSAMAFVSCGKAKTRESAPGSAGTPPPAQACPAATADACSTTSHNIADLTAQRDDAAGKNDAKTVARLSLQIGKQSELLALYQAGSPSPDTLSGLDSKYEQLNKLLEAELAKADAAPADSSGQSSGSGSDAADGSGSGSAGGSGSGSGNAAQPPVPELVYHPLEIQAVAEVMKDFGDLYIDESPKAADGTVGWEELSVPMPWASYWYPIRGDELYATDDSPLAKLDKAVNAAGGGRVGDAVDDAKKASLASGAESWEGLCAPWALAAISTPEPAKDVTVNGVDFSVTDQKALLTKIYERASSKIYGIRYQGTALTDGTIQDIRPEAFHQIFLQKLGVQKLPFAVDSDAGPEVWAKPVYRIRWSVKKDPTKDNAFVVRALPWMVIHRDVISADPTTGADRYAPTYDYRLYVDPKAKKSGKFKVIAGEWLNDSRTYHPDYIFVPVADGKLGSNNAGINDAMDVVRQIVGIQ